MCFACNYTQTNSYVLKLKKYTVAAPEIYSGAGS